MANLKEIRSRIASINSTMQITGAMKMVSAAKSKKAQDAIFAMKPYANKLSKLMQDLGNALGEDSVFLPGTQTPENVLVVAITSDRGLCGAFNSSVIKKSLEIKEQYPSVDFQTIGKKGNDVLQKTGNVEVFHAHLLDDLSFEKVSVIAENLMKAYTSGKYDKIILVYNTFKNVATQWVVTEDFLPIQPIENQQDTQTEKDYIFEPSQKEIVESLLPKSLKMQLFKALRDSLAAEHGARMTAMHKATDNATELRNQLKLTYNKARQAAITNEILEIVGGAEALNKG